MKRLILILSILSTCFVNAQKPETVYSFVRERHEISWYELQQKLWKEEIDKNKTNANAWFNYYRATRALAYCCVTEDKRNTNAELSDKIVNDAYSLIPTSFEANLMKSLNSKETKETTYLLKAYEINPLDVRTFDGLMVNYEFKQNKSEFEKFAVKMYEYNELPSSILNWGYNILAELDENAILFTGGDNDTYACWIIQAAKKHRQDVQIINTYMIRDDEYRKLLFKKLGLPNLDISFKEAKSELETEELFSKVVEHLRSSSKPIYAAASTVQSFEGKWSDQLYLTGLAYKFSKTSFDNASIIRRNYEKRYLLDHIRQTFSFNIGDGISDEFNSMYLPSMLKLYKSYQESEELFKMKDLEELILLISEKSGQQSEVIEALSDSKFKPTLLTALLNVNDLEKNMIQLKGNIYMDKFEITNGEYRNFLDNLKRSNQMDLYKTVLYDSTDWVTHFKGSTGFENDRDMYQWHPSYTNYPIVNISYEAAIAYCEWLTTQYNLQRKRKYTQVIFRLPTESEWRYAAGSGNENAKTSFPNDDPLTKEKCYLANYYPIPKSDTVIGNYVIDGAFTPTHVGTYNPNDLGFYNTFGNVSEMIAKKGVAKGGSWYNTFEECNFQKQINYTKPDCGIGFRIVMEVIEE